MKPQRTIIAGTRTITDPAILDRALVAAFAAGIARPTEVVSGCAAGVDALGEQWAKREMIPIKRFPADWRKHGKGAGQIRNQEMADYADQLIAIWDGVSHGTADMIRKAQYMRVFVYRVEQPPILTAGNIPLFPLEDYT